jgi:hypothetical protein
MNRRLSAMFWLTAWLHPRSNEASSNGIAADDGHPVGQPGAAGQELGRSAEARGRVQGDHACATASRQVACRSADAGANIEHAVLRSYVGEIGERDGRGVPERVKFVKPREIVGVQRVRIKRRFAQRVEQPVDDVRPFVVADAAARHIVWIHWTGIHSSYSVSNA